MKKFMTLALALVAVLSFGAIAKAQTDALTVTGSANTKKAGTKKKPRNITTKIGFTVDPNTKVTLKRVTYTFPKTIKVSGTGYKTCSLETIAGEGASACNKGSKVGSGTAVAFAGSTKIDFTFNIYAASAKTLVFALSSNVINTTFQGSIQGQKLVVDIPANVQQAVPGLYSTVESINATLGAKAVTKGKGKKKKTYNYIGNTGCPGGKQTVGVQLDVANGASPLPPLTGSVDIPCTK